MKTVTVSTFLLLNTCYFTTFVRHVYCFEKHVYTMTSHTLDNVSASDAIRTIKTDRQFSCLYSCLQEPICQGVFFHVVDEMCQLLDRQYESSSPSLTDYPGTKYNRLIPKTCSDLPYSEFDGSSQRYLVVDPDGTATKPITVLCDLTARPDKAVTMMHHDLEPAVQVDGYEACASYHAYINYDVSFQEAKRIVDASTSCEQKVKWRCYNAKLTFPNAVLPCTGWFNRSMEMSTYFTGSGSNSGYCESGGCKCNSEGSVWRVDEGYVTNKQDLPITGFFAGDTGVMSNGVDEVGEHTIGPVYCW